MTEFTTLPAVVLVDWADPRVDSSQVLQHSLANRLIFNLIGTTVFLSFSLFKTLSSQCSVALYPKCMINV